MQNLNLSEEQQNKLENIFNPQRSRVHGYVRADADLHVGKDLIVVPDDALIEGEPATHETDREAAPAKSDEADAHPWEERAAAESKRSSIWTRRTDAPAQVRSEPPPAEPRLKSETARAVENTRPSPVEDTPVEPSPLDRGDEEVTIAPGDKSGT